MLNTVGVLQSKMWRAPALDTPIAPSKNVLRRRTSTTIYRESLSPQSPCVHNVLFIHSLQSVKTPMNTCFPFPLARPSSLALVCVYIGRHLSFMPGTVTSCYCLSSCDENPPKIWKLKNDTAPKCTFSLARLPFMSLGRNEMFSPEVAGRHPGKCQEGEKEMVVLVQELNYGKFQNV